MSKSSRKFFSQLDRIADLLAEAIQPNSDYFKEIDKNIIAKDYLFSLLVLRYIEESPLSLLGSKPAIFRDAGASADDTVLIEAARQIGNALHANFLPDVLEGNNVSNSSLRAVLKLLKESQEKLDLHTLSSVFERVVSRSHTKKDGIFYTPPAVVKRIIHGALMPALKNNRDVPFKHLNILDPACGTGVFLFEAFRAIVNSSRDLLSFENRKALLVSSIFGVDKDAQAVEVAKLLLLLVLAEEKQLELEIDAAFPDLSSNIKVGNALLDTKDFDLADPKEQELAKTLLSFSFEEAFATIKGRGFDYVIGNPPYGLARDEQISLHENAKLKSVYKNLRDGKVNKYLLFMAKGFELLAKQGVLSFIVPNAWLGIRAGRSIRKLLIENQALSNILVFRCQVFAEPSVEAIIFLASKGKKHSKIRISHVPDVQAVELSDSFEIPVKAIEAPHYLIPTVWSESIHRVFSHIEDVSIDLGSAESPVVPSIALQAYAVGKGDPPQTVNDVREHVYHSITKKEADYYPYLEGADVKPWQLCWSGKYLKYGACLAEPQILERFKGPRIVIREIINPSPYLLIGCYTNELYLYNKSVLHVLPNNSAGEDEVLAILAILSSKVGSFVIRSRGRKSQRRIFPKIVQEDLKHFPIPKNLNQHVPALANLARIMLHELAKPDIAAPKSAPSSTLKTTLHTTPRIVELLEQIDSAAYLAYDLRNSDTALIDSEVHPNLS